jgi:peptide chain release factor 1
MSLSDTIRKLLEEAARREEEMLRRLQDPEVASDHERVARLSQELGEVRVLAEHHRRLVKLDGEIEESRSLVDSDDEEMRELAESALEAAEEERERLFESAAGYLVSRDEMGSRNVILEIRAGTGGDEAALFAADLFRMYSRFAERRGYRLEVLSAVQTGIGGTKEIIATISGKDVYQQLRFESGGHRVQRVPETESQGRIHTSLATVAVMPEAEKVEIDIRPDDLKIDFYRASGPGGQKVNKTSSAVRIVHIPTGLKVECQDEKSQHKNRARAMKILNARIFDHQRRKVEEERSSLRRSQIGSGDRNERIRTYNFPQSRVTDHRANVNLYDLDSVMDGDLDELLDRLAEFDRQRKLEGLGDEPV